MVASNCPTSKCPLAFAHEQIGTSICPNARQARQGECFRFRFALRHASRVENRTFHRGKMCKNV